MTNEELSQKVANNTDLRRHETNCGRFISSGNCSCFILTQARIGIDRKYGKNYDESE